LEELTAFYLCDQRDDKHNSSAAKNATTSMTARARARSTASTTTLHDKQEHNCTPQQARAGARSTALSLFRKTQLHEIFLLLEPFSLL